MDASTPAAAVQLAQAAADRAELLLARERAAMANEDACSYVAQRHFVGSLQVPRDHGDAPMTWQEAYEFRHEHWRQAVAAMRAAARANQARDAPAVERALREQIGSDSEQEEEDLEDDQEADEEEDLEEDQEAEEEVEQVVEQVRGFTPFSGTGYRLG